MKFNRTLVVVSCLLAAPVLTGCGAMLDPKSVQATSGSPESSSAEVVSIPHDPARPMYVVAVEPFVFRETHAEGANVLSIHVRNSGEQLAAKLTTALANVGNISVLDSGLTKSKNGTFKARLEKGEVGPYVVRATVTEYNEVAEASSESTNVSLGWLGVVGGVAGAVTGKSGLAWTGAGLAAANPSYNNQTAEKKGVVAIDFRVVDGRNGRVVAAFKSSGTFKSGAAARGMSLFGIGKSSTKVAQSAVEQAVVVALNDAVQQINDKLPSNIKTASLSK